jgi:hypothetical protein
VKSASGRRYRWAASQASSFTGFILSCPPRGRVEATRS